MQDAALMEKVIRAVREATDHRADPKPADRLVEDLGFDSMRMASLALALEDELGAPVLLNDWIASVSSSSELTVRSLAAYLADRFEQGA